MTKTEIILNCVAIIAQMAKNYHFNMHSQTSGFLHCQEQYCTEARRVMREIGEYQ